MTCGPWRRVAFDGVRAGGFRGLWPVGVCRWGKCGCVNAQKRAASIAGGLVCRPPPIDNQRGSRHQCRRVACQEHHRPHQVLHGPEASELDAAQDVVAEGGVCKERPGQRRIDEGGADGIHPDSERCEVDGHGLGQTLDAVLGHAVDGAVPAANMAHLGGDVDDRPALPGRRHFSRHRLGDEEGRALVQAGDGVVVVLGDVQEAAGAVGAGIVDQNVERGGGVDRGVHGGQIGNIQREGSAWPPFAEISRAASVISATVRATRVT